MSASLDEEYFTWLYSHVGSVKLRNKSRTHWSLLRQLYQKEFIWVIPNDDNRVEDGKELRTEFLGEGDGWSRREKRLWLDLPCSMLEMLIGLARRLSFEAEGEPHVWFWHLLETLELSQYNDHNYDNDIARKVDEILERVIWRTYDPDGHGGLFPLQNAEQDQTRVEIWYQLNAYLLELELL